MATTPLHLLRQTVTVERSTEANDSGGSPVQTWAQHLTAVAVSVQPMKAAKAMKYGALRGPRMVTVFAAPNNDIQSDDRLVYSDDRTGTATTRYFRVATAPLNLIEQDVVIELDCEEVAATP
jgi:head-tail adaptor